MVWCDPLYDGPVPDVPDEELLRIRARFLAASDSAAGAVLADLAGWRKAVDDHAQYDELVLWFEHDLFDQLNLIQLLAHIDRQGGASKPLSLICINAYPGHSNFKGLGELEPEDIAALFPTRRPVIAAQFDLATRAWAAFRSADPRTIETLINGDTSALPYLAPALARHLEEFPSAIDGLSRSERRLMQLASQAPADLQRAFPAMHEGERAFYITESTFLSRARSLSESTPPLLTLHVTPGRAHTLPAGTIALTDAGRDVLNGRADRLALCGIDRWIGGVRVTGHGPAWRWSDKAGTIVLP